MMRRRWAWLLLAALLIGGVWSILPKKQKGPEPRLASEVDAEKMARILQPGRSGVSAPALSGPLQVVTPEAVVEKWLGKARPFPQGLLVLDATQFFYSNPKTGEGGLLQAKLSKDAGSFLREYRQLQSEKGSGLYLVFYPEGAEKTEENRYVLTNHLLLVGASADLEAQVQSSLGLSFVKDFAFAPGIKEYRAADAVTALAALEALGSRKSDLAEPIFLAKIEPCGAPNDPLYPFQWHLKAEAQKSGNLRSAVMPGEDILVEDVWGYPSGPGKRGSGVDVVVLDDGIELTHPDLTNNLRPLLLHQSFTLVDTGGAPGSTDFHGTTVAGVIGARGNNNLGVCGVAPEAFLTSYRIFGNGDTSVWETKSWEALGINNDWIEIKNNSWGATAPYVNFVSLMEASLSDARLYGRSSRGTIIVFAAGNSAANGWRSDYYEYSKDRGIIFVGALDHLGAKAEYSSPGASVLVAAPSGNLFPTAPTTTTTDRVGPVGYNTNSANNNHANLDYTASFNGTSSAAPVVSGVVALMLEANPFLSWRDVQEILVRTAAQNAPQDPEWSVNAAGFPINEKFGFGCVQAKAAVEMASNWTNLQPEYTRSVTNNIVQSLGNGNGAEVFIPLDLTGGTALRCESVTIELNLNKCAPRKELTIDLTSPSGTVSTFAKPFSEDGLKYFLPWTFRTVRHWGESDQGIWMLRIKRGTTVTTDTNQTHVSTILTTYGCLMSETNSLPPVVRVYLAAGALVPEGASGNPTVGTLLSSGLGANPVYSLVSGRGDLHNSFFQTQGSSIVLSQNLDLSKVDWVALSQGEPALRIRVRGTSADGQISKEASLILPVSPQSTHPPSSLLLVDFSRWPWIFSSRLPVLQGSRDGTGEFTGSKVLPAGLSCGWFIVEDADIFRQENRRAFDDLTDGLSGDNFTYTLVAGDGDQGNVNFLIEGRTLKLKNTLLYPDGQDGRPSVPYIFPIRARVTDGAGLSIDKKFTIIFYNVVGDNDADNDQWDDYFEYGHFGSLDQNPNDDYDNDGVKNIDENSRRPTIANSLLTLSEVVVGYEFNPLEETTATSWRLLGHLATNDSLLDDTRTYSFSLVSGVGSDHNENFLISGNQIYVKGPVDYDTTSELKFRIRASGLSVLEEIETALVLPVVRDPARDKDFDSLPDAWEEQIFGNLNQGPWGDMDGDGCPNRLEYVSGSDATNAAVTGSTGVRQWGYLGFLDPVPAEATNLVSMASGWRHMVGIRSNGTVVAWGYNNAGEIAVPAGLTNVLAVAAGKEFSVALKGDGTVVGWGLNDYGQADAKSFLPLKIREIAAGNAHVVARMEDGTVRVWGGGDGVSQLPAGLSGVRSVAAGTDSGMVVQADRTALGWGFSQTNTGLDGKYGQAKAPASLTNARALAFGGFHTLALGTNGTVTAWGSNSDGQSTVPASATNVVKIAAGLNSWHSLALRADGTVLGWGAAAYAGAVPSDLTNAVDIAGGYFHGAALAATVTTQAPPNRPPTDITLSLSGGSVPENTAFGATIGLFVVADPDSGDGQTLSLASGSGDSDNWMVQVSGMSLLLNTSLNYEFKSSLAIRVRTTDAVGNIYEKSFVVPVGNILTDDDDYDGLTEAEEIAFGTSTSLQDTDNDGFLDYAEKMAGSAGNNASKIPNEIKDFLKFQTMTNGPETRSFVFFTRMNHKHTVMSSTNLVTWTNDATIYPTNPFIGNGRHTNMSIYTYSPKFFMKIITVTNSNSTIHPPGGGGMGPGM